MIIERISVKNFLSHAQSEVDFTDSNLWLICGENGAGKSALFDALEYALYGRHRGGRTERRQKPTAKQEEERRHGGDQHARLLVKQGAARAVIEIIFRLNGHRYCVRHQIDAQDGNLGGTLAEWDSSVAAWRPKSVPGGKDAVWMWLAKRMPPHPLFRSAIYLRQGHADFFLDCTSTERIKRFGELVDLSRYTALSVAAGKRADAAKARRNDAQSKLVGLGDVSDRARADLERLLEAAERTYANAEGQVKQAEKVAKDAAAWAELLGREVNLVEELASLQTLLDKETEIKCAHAAVQAWDRALHSLEQYWTQREGAARHRADAETAQKNAEGLDKDCATKRAERDEMQGALDALRHEALPTAEQLAEALAAQARATKLEADIAYARAALEQAQKDLARLTEKDDELERMRARERALPRLQRLAEARQGAEKALGNVEDAVCRVPPLDTLLARGRVALEALERALSEAQEAVADAHQKAQQLTNEVTELKTRTGSHRSLTGDEQECPVCAQPLNEDAYRHVHEVLATETQRLGEVQRELNEAEKIAKRAVERRAALDGLQRDADRAVQRLADAEEAVRTNDAQYIGMLENVSEPWIAAETKEIKAALSKLSEDAKQLGVAREAEAKASGSLGALRKQRADAANPRGDVEAAATLREEETRLSAQAKKAEETLRELRGQEGERQKTINQLAQAVTRLEEQSRAAREQAQRAQADTLKAEREADGIYEELRGAWAAILVDRKTFEARRQNVEDQRELAEQVSELLTARGKLEVVQRQQAEVEEAKGKLNPAHRVAVEDADNRLREAQDEQLNVNAKVVRLEGNLTQLKGKQKEAGEYQETINAADAEAHTFAELTDLLKEGGPIQVEVAEREQQQIALEVNRVLEKLGDPLRVRLGEARHKRGTELQDILILDRSDPNAEPRYFEFLSGGEQFRVALALALALHHRVERGVVGTIIVDEGFGALDSNRRDELARQMANTSQGILGLGLANSIIICSHSSEVQRHFPDRWLIRKEAGIATVERINGHEVSVLDE